MAFPKIARPDVGTIVVTPRYAGSRERQRELADAALSVWDDRTWPGGLISLSAFVSTDGEAGLTYAQWSDDTALYAVLDAARPDDADPVRYRLYRSLATESKSETESESESGTRVPGCLVTATFDVDGPERQRYFVDRVIDAQPDTEGHPGAISAHFHLSTDGTRVLIYTEWTSEQAHEDAATRGDHDEVHDLFSGVPGVRSTRGRRYHLHGSREAASAPRAWRTPAR